MLSLEKCRKILGPDCNLPDSDLELLRDQLYGLADVSIDSFLQEKRDKVRGPSKIKIQPAEQLTDTELENWEERAAMMEFEGKLLRSEAESLALNDFARSKRNPQ